MTVTEMIRFGLSLLCTLTGLFAISSAVFGIFKFKHALTRLHSAALIDTMGVLFMLLGVMIAEGLDIASLKMLAVILILWVTSPVASHLVSRLEIVTDDDMDRYMTVDAPDMVQAEKEGK